VKGGVSVFIGVVLLVDKFTGEQVYEYTSWQGQLLVDELTNKQVYKVALYVSALTRD